MTNKEITRALTILRPKAQWTLHGDNFNDINWLDTEQTQPTLAEIEAEIKNPAPLNEPTVEDKLSSVGLSIDDLKAALGI